MIESRLYAYGKDSIRQVYKEYTLKVSQSTKNAIKYPICFIHGGAWRDPKNDYNDYEKLIRYIDNAFLVKGNAESRSAKIQFFSIDYRLSPEVRHPKHLTDVLQCLKSISKKFDVTDVTLCGHSVGATLITQILERQKILKEYRIPEEQFEPLPNIRRVMFLDGIYDVNSLLREYPSYNSFVGEAFKDNDYVSKCNMISSGTKSQEAAGIYNALERIVILHSSRDQLLSFQQPEEFVNWLLEIGVDESKLKGCYWIDDFGKHNEVYQSPKVADLLVDDIISRTK